MKYSSNRENPVFNRGISTMVRIRKSGTLKMKNMSAIPADLLAICIVLSSLSESKSDFQASNPVATAAKIPGNITERKLSGNNIIAITKKIAIYRNIRK
jgi:hypothetical protein